MRGIRLRTASQRPLVAHPAQDKGAGASDFRTEFALSEERNIIRLSLQHDVLTPSVCPAFSHLLWNTGFEVILLFKLRCYLQISTCNFSTSVLFSRYFLEVPDLAYWCHSPGLTNGEVTCRSPRGPSYRSTLGTRCDMKCDPGYRLIGRNAIQCLANRRWSGTAICRKMRCHVLPLAYHGSYTCSQGFMVDSRCDFRCDPGYRFEGEHSRTCLKSGLWSGVQPVCSDMDPPKIKCPLSRLKFAQPGKLVATVSWDRPVASDTADKSLEVILVGPEPGSEFKEGPTIIRYKVYDQAKNRAACKFIVRVEALDLKSSHLKTASSLLDQFYEKRRLLIVSAPNITDPDYQLQNMMIQTSDCGLDLRHVTVVELLGSPPRETGRIKEDSLTADVIEGLNPMLHLMKGC
ncbi:sushi repeat-containing protein SRPX2-like [Periophthalmus magnuspinnatus]|uniref:sushi repeat-containing protein SRPX2-like n=1 Tax=Periophthalmus magnuspinnatus TaxID=409849 RepID=UPI0024365692|nr:sushi repeat-containing protein SRPX2-like [Periophthalmus magnuspinnatus]